MPPKKNRKKSKKKNTANSNPNQTATTFTSASNLTADLFSLLLSSTQADPNQMPPKKNNSKQKNTTTTTNTASSSSSFTNPAPSLFYGNPRDDFGFDSDDDCYDYQDYDDFTNPFDPSHHEFHIKKSNKAPVFHVAQDLDAFVNAGGKKTHQSLLKLPLDLFLNIVSRLPIKPLAVCRCVCKTWCTILHHPRFTKMHHFRVTQQQLPNSILFHVSATLLCELNDIDSLSQVIVLECEEEDAFDEGVVAIPQFMPDKTQIKPSDLKFDIVGSCNGLLLLGTPVYCDPIYVCNPVVGEYMSLPPTYKKTGFDIVSGIGFDQVANEYKVVRLIFNFLELRSESSGRMEAEVYTLGSGKWRKLGKFPYPHCRRSSQVFVKGALHWMADNYGSEYGDSELVIAFDVEKEEFRVVPPPPDFTQTIPEDCDDSAMHLGELGGRLCLFAYYYDDLCEVWVMKDYGVKDSWTKEYVISRKYFGFNDLYFRPVKLMKNGNIIMVVNSQAVACYDPTSKQILKLQIHLPPRFDAITHVGSFISLRDIAGPKDSKCSVNNGGWYGIMKSITSHNPEFDIEAWKLNEQLRRLWWESH